MQYEMRSFVFKKKYLPLHQIAAQTFEFHVDFK